jgi:DNA gyrase/topoisomerase IV subunit B
MCLACCCLPFCCRGKLLNVRDATALQISENQEIQHIKQILGLQHGKNYEDVKALRYGHLMIMTDQVRKAEWKAPRHCHLCF